MFTSFYFSVHFSLYLDCIEFGVEVGVGIKNGNGSW